MELQKTLANQTRKLLLAGNADSTEAAAQAVIDEFVANRINSPLDEFATKHQITAQISGYGVLQALLDDPAIEEIWVNQPNEVFYSRRGETFREQIELNSAELQTFIQRMLRSSNRRVDRLSPFADSSVEGGSRLHVVIPEITAAHWAMNLRKFQNSFRELGQLEAAGMLSAAAASFLRTEVCAGKNILISGPTQAGKTTMLSALLSELPSQTRLISCEETFEIKCSLGDWVAMQTRQSNIEGTGEIPLRRLVKEALRMRPERLVIGEVREAESFDLLIAMNSGIPGMCTIHANSAQAALQKLATLPLLAGPNISSEFVTAIIGQSLDLVVQLGFIEGARAVTQICTVNNTDKRLEAIEVTF